MYFPAIVLFEYFLAAAGAGLGKGVGVGGGCTEDAESRQQLSYCQGRLQTFNRSQREQIESTHRAQCHSQ